MFFSPVNIPCVNLIFGQSKNQEGKKKKFPPNIIFLFPILVWIFCNDISSVAQLCPTICDPMNRSTPGLPVHHQLP